MPAKRRPNTLIAFGLSLLLSLITAAVQAEDPTPGPKSPTPLGPEVWVGAPIVGDSPCEMLEQRVCGENGACANQPACAEVRSLLEQERQQRAADGASNRMTYASGQCQEADRDRRTYVSCGL